MAPLNVRKSQPMVTTRKPSRLPMFGSWSRVPFHSASPMVPAMAEASNRDGMVRSP